MTLGTVFGSQGSSWQAHVQQMLEGMPPGVRYLDHGFYWISEALARELAGELPKPGWEKCVVWRGEHWWLARTPHQGQRVWSIRRCLRQSRA